jgi:hypothetical protein
MHADTPTRRRARPRWRHSLRIGGSSKSVLETRLQHLARYVDAIGALVPY